MGVRVSMYDSGTESACRSTAPFLVLCYRNPVRLGRNRPPGVIWRVAPYAPRFVLSGAEGSLPPVRSQATLAGAPRSGPSAVNGLVRWCQTLAVRKTLPGALVHVHTRPLE